MPESAESAEKGVKVVFALDREDEDWPPVVREGVWARSLGDGEYQLDNVPWLARNVSYGDRVRAEPETDGTLLVRERVEWSGRYTLRVIPLGEGSARDVVREVVDLFSRLGAECESALPSFKVVAVDVPPSADVRGIKMLLRDGEADGRWGYEEGCIDERWAAI